MLAPFTKKPLDQVNLLQIVQVYCYDEQKAMKSFPSLVRVSPAGVYLSLSDQHIDLTEPCLVSIDLVGGRAGLGQRADLLVRQGRQAAGKGVLHQERPGPVRRECFLYVP